MEKTIKKIKNLKNKKFKNFKVDEELKYSIKLTLLIMAYGLGSYAIGKNNGRYEKKIETTTIEEAESEKIEEAYEQTYLKDRLYVVDFNDQLYICYDPNRMDFYHEINGVTTFESFPLRDYDDEIVDYTNVESDSIKRLAYYMNDEELNLLEQNNDKLRKSELDSIYLRIRNEKDKANKQKKIKKFIYNIWQSATSEENY